jgi:hypothetical protein
VTASAFGYESLTKDIDVSENETLMLVFRLHKVGTGTITGRVTDLSNSPINGAKVEILDTPLAPQYTNNQGYYTFYDVPGNATYDVKASASGYYSSIESNVYLPEGGTVTVNFALEVEEEEGCLVSGSLAGNAIDHLDRYYRFRDFVLSGTSRGESYIQLFYRYTLPLWLNIYPDITLRNRIRDLIIVFADDISNLTMLKSGAEADPDAIPLTDERVRSIEAILEELEGKSDSEFAPLWSTLRAELKRYEGKTAREILALLQ